jgi:hypothetical protein
VTSGKESSGKDLPVCNEPPIAEYAVDFTTPAQSPAFGARTKIVRLQANSKAHVAFGTDPTATNSHKYLFTDIPEYFGVQPGHKVSVYDGTS